MTKHWFAAALVLSVFVSATPASAAVVLITQAKAVAGSVTPGDAPGFPVTLSLPGAYRLETNLTVPANQNGISITSHFVDIDMNGFLLNGANSAGVSVANIGVISQRGISTIHDGTIVNFKFDGIRLTGALVNSWVVKDMQIVGNGGRGIDGTTSHYSRFLNNAILVNGGVGIRCAEYCHVEGNNISDNGSYGVLISSGTVLGNTIFSNGSSGVSDSQGDEDTGIGNNTIARNSSGGGFQTVNTRPMEPNVCSPTICN